MFAAPTAADKAAALESSRLAAVDPEAVAQEAYAEAKKKEIAARETFYVPFGVGELGYMQNPFYKDGTRLRLGPDVTDGFSDDHLLNDHQVEIIEVLGDSAKVRQTNESAKEGWVRQRNLSRIERSAGLADLEQLAQMAVEALQQREVQISELEDAMHAREEEFEGLREQLIALQAENADLKMENSDFRAQAEAAAATPPPTQPAQESLDVGVGDAPTFAPASESAARPGLTRDASGSSGRMPGLTRRDSSVVVGATGSFKKTPGLHSFSEGDVGWMFNPVTEGTRLRDGPYADAGFVGIAFVRNDVEVEVLTVTGEFCQVRAVTDKADDDKAEGWVRTRYISRHAKGADFAMNALRNSYIDVSAARSVLERDATGGSGSVLDENVSVPATPPVTRDPSAAIEASSPAKGTDKALSPKVAERVESRANTAEYKEAIKAQALDQLANTMAAELKTALARANLRTMELYREWDSEGVGSLSKKAFCKVMSAFQQGMGTKNTQEELEGVFDRWDVDKSGSLDFQELDRAIRGATANSIRAAEKGGVTGASLSAALQDRLGGKAKGGAVKGKDAKDAKGKGKGEEVKAPPKRTEYKSRKKLEEEKAAAEEEAAEGAEQKWNAAQWLKSLSLHELVAGALELPEAGTPQYNYVRRMDRGRLEKMLSNTKGQELLTAISEMILEACEEMRGKGKSLQDGAVKSDKFQSSAKFQMSYGSLSLFYGGLESLLGPPKMYKGSLFGAMEYEHCAQSDAEIEFTTSNGSTSTSKIEWEVVVAPRKEKGKWAYAERADLVGKASAYARSILSLEDMMEKMEVEANQHLRKDGHTELIKEELVGGRMYTGACYAKYNAVLRAKSKDPYLVEQMKKTTLGNTYTTSIHAINSCVLKLSKLTKAGKVWRGIKDAKLPKSFWVANSMGVRGGIEYGFSSTTTDKAQAMHYAGGDMMKDGDASTIFEMQMGMVDRGADLTWLSQYPFEREVLLPPLTGIEALDTNVSGGMLVINARLSLNMAAHTLEQVLSRRRKMLMDMCKGIELELRDVLDFKLATFSVKLLNHAMNFGPLSEHTEWFNNDDNFAMVMSSTLSLQHVLTSEAQKLFSHLEKPEISFRNWDKRGPSRMIMLGGWVLSRTSPNEVFIDLNNADLTSDDGVTLAKALGGIPKLTSVDVRGNPKLAGEGLKALIQAMKEEKPGHPRSLCGVSSLNTQLAVQRKWTPEQQVDRELAVAELESHLYSESVTAGMGGKSSGDQITLNRRGGGGASDKGGWYPLNWAAKTDHLQVGEQLLKNGYDVNKQEGAGSGSQKWSALHQAVYSKRPEFVKMLLAWGADVTLKDVNGNSPAALAEKSGNNDIITMVKEAKPTVTKAAKAKTKGEK